MKKYLTFLILVFFLISIQGVFAEITEISLSTEKEDVYLKGNIELIIENNEEVYLIKPDTPINISIKNKLNQEQMTKILEINGTGDGKLVRTDLSFELLLTAQKNLTIKNISIFEEETEIKENELFANGVLYYNFEKEELRILKGEILIKSAGEPDIHIKQLGESNILESLYFSYQKIKGKKFEVDTSNNLIKIDSEENVELIRKDEEYEIYLKDKAKIWFGSYSIRLDENGRTIMNSFQSEKSIDIPCKIYFKGRDIATLKEGNFGQHMLEYNCPSEGTAMVSCSFKRENQVNERNPSAHSLIDLTDATSYHDFLAYWKGTISFKEKKIDLLNLLPTHIITIDPSYYDIKLLTAKTVIGKPTTTLKKMVDKSGAIAGINGGFFAPNGNPVSLFIEEGRKIHSESKSRFMNSIFYVHNNNIEIVPDTLFNKMTINPQYALESHELISEGIPSLKQLGTQEWYFFGPNCRSVACIGYDGSLKLIAAKWQPLPTLTKALLPECAHAINLDGGGSTSLEYRGLNEYHSIQYKRGYEKHETENKEIDSGGQIANAILIFRKNSNLIRLT